MNKKGFIMELIVFSVIGIMAILFFAGWIYGSNLINTNLRAVQISSDANISYAAQQIYTPLDSGYTSGLHLIALVILIAYAISTLIVAYFSKNHPIFLIIYIFAAILVIIFSVYISNQYQNLLSNATLGSTLQGFGIASIIMNYLPYWIAAISLVGIILSIVFIYRGDQL